jgi:8-oxo-dGTP pyrophosphatase MutT (NUDIX family)
MTIKSPTARIEKLATISYRLITDGIWHFEQDRADEIDAHWQKRVADNPHLFNGRVLLMQTAEIIERRGQRCLNGTSFLANYKSFIAWRDFGFPDPSIFNVFAMAALRSADGAFLLGEMGPTTASAGRIYFPAGTPDENDLKDGTIDFEGSVLRELKEETGLSQNDVRLDPDWSVVFQGPYIACMKTIRSALTAAELVTRVDAFLAQEAAPELARLKPVFSPADLEPDHMPEFVRAYMQRVWSENG